MKHRFKAEATNAAAGLSTFGGLFNFFSGNLTRKTLLFVVVPLIFLSYFGTLVFAIFRFPEAYDWRDSVMHLGGGARLPSPVGRRSRCARLGTEATERQ
jgi:hypothetical protein